MAGRMGQGSPPLPGPSSDVLCPTCLEDRDSSRCQLRAAAGQITAPTLRPTAPWGTGCALHVTGRTHRQFPASRRAAVLVVMAWGRAWGQALAFAAPFATGLPARPRDLRPRPLARRGGGPLLRPPPPTPTLPPTAGRRLLPRRLAGPPRS